MPSHPSFGTLCSNDIGGTSALIAGGRSLGRRLRFILS